MPHNREKTSMIQSENSNTLSVDADQGQNVSGTISNVDVWLTPSDSPDVHGWRSIGTIPTDRPVQAWNLTWKCPVAIQRRSWGHRSAWVEKTLTMEWPLEAFSHWMEMPEPPVLP